MTALVSFLQGGYHIGYNPARLDYSEPIETFFKKFQGLFLSTA